MDGRGPEPDVRPVEAGGAGPLGEQGDAQRVLAGPRPDAATARADAPLRSTPRRMPPRRTRRPRRRRAPPGRPRRRSPASRPPARMTGISRATAAAIRRATRLPVPPGCGPPAVSRRSRSVPAARYALPASIALAATDAARPRDPSPRRPHPRPAGGATFQTGRRTPRSTRRARRRRAGSRPDRSPAMAASISAAGASAVTATTRGRVPAARGPARQRGQPRGLGQGEAARRPGTKLRPMASAPERSADSTPSASVTPQILTSGLPRLRRHVERHRPRRHEGAGRRGRVGRAHQRLPDEGGVEPDRPPADQRPGLADARLGDHQAVVRHERSQAEAAGPGRPRGSAGSGC